tara:strand:+ start:174 stop:467 length:294 start_codon:yes stop_codon:yes gene_type:complete
MEWLVGKLGGAAVGYAAGGVGAVAIAWALKKIPNRVLKAKFGALMYGLGVTSTLGLGKWKITKKFWNKTIEPYIVDAIDNIVGHGIKEYIRGLRSDN